MTHCRSTFLHTAGPIAFCFLLIFGHAMRADAQTKEQIRQQADARLKTMTPAEIDAKIRELGLTKAEAVQKANEVGISLDQYILQQSGQEVYDVSGLTGDTLHLMPDSLQNMSMDRGRRKFKKLRTIPGFTGRVGIDSSIQPFGYDIFDLPATTFQPSLNVATPPTYQVGVGDEIVIIVWGETKLTYQLIVNKEGNLIIPDVGPIDASGMTIQQLKKKLLSRFTAVYASLRNGAPDASSFLDVSLGKIKTFQVLVLGEVEMPGSYPVSSMATVMTALYAAGGPTAFGTLRDVQVKREGKLFKSVDLYEYILRADNSKDIRLQDGDIVFVKPVGRRVAVVGHLFRPAIYELRASDRMKDALANAGGLLFDSYFKRVHVERIIPFEKRADYDKSVLDLDLTFPTVEALRSSPFELEDGDIITVRKINELFQNRVTITGNVKKPGVYEIRKSMGVKDLILAADSLKYTAFSRGLLFRVLPDRKKQTMSFDPNLALSGDDANNLSLMSEDSVVVFAEKDFLESRTVQIRGAVLHPGIYPRFQHQSLMDLLVMAGGTYEYAMCQELEVSHIDTVNTLSFATTEKVPIANEYWNDPAAKNYLLRDFDYVFVPKDPKFGEIRNVAVFGRVKYPGYYAVKNSDERISDVIHRAGGLIEGAYLEASEYFRRSKGTGKVPVDLKKAYDEHDAPDNLLVNGGDSIYVWWKDDIVFVRGEVYVPSPVVYKKGASLDYYIAQAGGYTEDANDGATSVYLPTGKKWEPSFFIFPDPDILPGSTVIVPKKVDKPDTIFPYIRDIVTILASLAAITVSVVTIAKLK